MNGIPAALRDARSLVGRSLLTAAGSSFERSSSLDARGKALPTWAPTADGAPLAGAGQFPGNITADGEHPLDTVARRTGRDLADASLNAAVDQVVERLRRTASDTDAFDTLFRQSFGDSIERASVEQLRTRLLAGDRSWLPEFRVVEPSVLADTGDERVGQAAYVAGSDTVLVSRDAFLGDAAQTTAIVAEELGHALDARLNTTDTAGDEGEVFARLSAGESLDADTLARLRSEDDRGSIVFDGKTVEVEFFVNKLVDTVKRGFDKVGDAVSGVVDTASGTIKRSVGAVADTVSRVVDGARELVDGTLDGIKRVGTTVIDTASALGREVERGFKRAMESETLGQIMSIASLVPIPAVQVVARAYSAARGAYHAYQGVKHGSLGMVLEGIAGAAGGVSKLGQLVNAGRVADVAGDIAYWSRAGALVHRATSERDFGLAGEALGMVFGRSDSATLQQLSRIGYQVADVQDAYRAIRDGKWAEAALTAVDLVGRDDIQDIMYRLGGPPADIATIAERLESGDYRGATELFNARFADTLRLSEEFQRDLRRGAAILENRDAIEAILTASDGDDPATWERIDALTNSMGIALHPNDRRNIERAFAFRDAIDAGDVSMAFKLASDGAVDLGHGLTGLAIGGARTVMNALLEFTAHSHRLSSHPERAAADAPTPALSKATE